MMKTSDTYQLTNLPSLMRAHKITIRQLAAHMDITMKRVREVRNGARVSLLAATDFNQAVFEIVNARGAAAFAAAAAPAGDTTGVL